jgi:hypothetical protein
MILRGLVLVFACVFSVRAAEEFRGYSSVNQLLQERLMRPGSVFELGQFLGQRYSEGESNLLDLMGTYKSGLWGSPGFKNGQPNALNMLLWHLVLSGLSQDMGRVCADEQKVEYSDEWLEVLKNICAAPQGHALGGDQLLQFWLAAMGYDAPRSEFEQWQAFVNAPELVSLPRPEAVEWMSLALLNNPYFLLRR